MINSIIGILAAIVAFFYYQNKRLKRKLIDTELKTEKENLNEAQKKSSGTRSRFIDLLNEYSKKD